MAVLASFAGVLGLSFFFVLHLVMGPSSLQAGMQQPHVVPRSGFDLASGFSSTWKNVEGEQVRQRLLQVLASRRRQAVEPVEILTALPRLRPYLQENAASFVDPEVLALCPKAERARHHNRLELEEEDVVLRAEVGEQGKIPLLIIRPKWHHSKKRRPVVICMHSTGHSKESMRPFMEAYASMGYVAVAVDARHHGDRGHTPRAYAEALISGWKTGLDMPFVFDTVWDVIKVVDYLTGRPDVDPERIGMMGISLGGMHTWFTAVADPRITAALPLIGVQNFGWAVANDRWQARVGSIIDVFQVAAHDLGKDEIDAETVAAVWQRLAPGLMDFLDSPLSVPAIAPRPLLIYNGKEDPRCPVQGLGPVLLRSAERYKEAGVPNHLQFIAEEGLAHAVSEEMSDTAIRWFNKHLRL